MGECHRVVSEELFRRRIAAAEAAGKRLILLETGHDHPGLLHGGKSRSFFAAGAETFRQSSLAAVPARTGREIPLSPAERAS